MNTIKLGDIAKLISKGTTPTSVGLTFAPTGLPFLRGEDIQGNAVDFSKVRMFISESSSSKLSRSELQKGDVLITIAGTIGRVGYIDKDVKANCNQAVAFVRLNLDEVDPLWLCFTLQSKKYQQYFLDFIVGGAIPNINLHQISSIEIPDIPIEQQRIIAKNITAQLLEIEKIKTAINSSLNDLAILNERVFEQSHNL
ncbi:MAG: restriction endonuclease subunit S [Bacteroidia bacterium]|nr:restriction endonuclease subunit S [Bacteroidia bacterium]